MHSNRSVSPPQRAEHHKRETVPNEKDSRIHIRPRFCKLQRQPTVAVCAFYSRTTGSSSTARAPCLRISRAIKMEIEGGAAGGGEEYTVYNMKHMERQAKETVENISTLTSFRSSVYARTGIYKSREHVLETLSFIKNEFTWFNFDTTNLEHASSFFCRDRQGVHDVHLTGYLVTCDQIPNGTYVFRACVAEFHEKMTFDQIFYKIFGSGTSILAGVGGGATTGALVSIPFETVAPGAAAAVGAVLGGLAGGIGAIFVKVTADSREKQVEKKLGTDLYDASTNRTNSNAIMEALLMHYLLAKQTYTIDGKKLSIQGVVEDSR
ncbi:unnamed protein product [Ectocarpus sp. 12 AP-2014]